MTVRAKELTLHAKAGSADSAPLVKQPVRDLRAFLDAFGRLGYDTGDLLSAAELKPSDLEDPDSQVPCSATGAIIARAQKLRPFLNIALRLAVETPLGAYPLLDYLVVSSDSVGEAFERLQRYLRIVGNPVDLEIFADQDPARVVASCPSSPFALEYVLSLAVLHLGRETGGRLKVAALEFAHSVDDVAEFERRLRCPVHAQSGWSGFLIPRVSWQLPLRRRDAILHGVLRRQADEVVARSPRITSAAFEVARLLALRVAGRDTRLQVLARQMGTSARTLQRKLAEEGVSYHALLEEARRRAAEGYLAEPTLSVGEIGYLLGYSEPAAFHRAFRRWHRSTPAAYRQRVSARRA